MNGESMRHGTVRGDGFLKHLLSVVAAALFSSLSLAAAPNFVTGGDAEWFQDADGSWRSGAVPVHGMTWIAETVTGPGTWTCEWRISSDKDCGYVSMWVDGVEEIFYDTGSGFSDYTAWIPLMYFVGAGEHTIVVSYEKNYESPSNYAECAWVRNWKWTPRSPAVTWTAGHYFKKTLPELGYDVPTNGVTAYSVVGKGLPAGLELKSNAAVKDKKGKIIKKAKVEWWIEGVPTAAHDYTTNPAYLVITANGKTETLPLSLSVLAQDVTPLADLELG